MSSLKRPPTLIKWPVAAPECGGIIKRDPSDFIVEELPAYPLSGEGDFTWLWIEKEDLATNIFLKILSERTGINASEFGIAGQKDRRAITRQWVSLPRKAVLDDLNAPIDEGGRIEVLEHGRHHHKLRTGHLKGNRFRIMIRNLEHADHEAMAQRAAVISEVGFANGFGEQRFGRGNTVNIGLNALQGNKVRHKRTLRLGVSALQAALYNFWLQARAERNLLGQVVAGDVLKKRDSGGMFTSDEPELDQTRMDSGELVETGPVFGWKAMRPRDTAKSYEDEVLDTYDISIEDFRPLKKLALGTRRPARVWPNGLKVTPHGEDVMLEFELPAGSYATTLCRLIVSSTLTVGN